MPSSNNLSAPSLLNGVEKKVTADFSNHMGVTALSTSDFAEAIIENIKQN